MNLKNTVFCVNCEELYETDRKILPRPKCGFTRPVLLTTWLPSILSPECNRTRRGLLERIPVVRLLAKHREVAY